MTDLTKMTYSQKGKFLGNLRNKYRSIAIKDQDTSEAKELLKEIYNLDRELKEIDSSIGTTYRN